MAERPDRFISPRQVDIRAGHFGGGEGNVDVIMGVDPDSLGYDVGHSRIGHIRRPAQARTQHRSQHLLS